MKNDIYISDHNGEIELFECWYVDCSDWQEALSRMYGGTFKYQEADMEGVEKISFEIVEKADSDYRDNGLVKMIFSPDYDEPTEILIHYGDVITKSIGFLQSDGTIYNPCDGHICIDVISEDTFDKEYYMIDEFILNLCDIAEIKGIRDFIDSVQW